MKKHYQISLMVTLMTLMAFILLFNLNCGGGDDDDTTLTGSSSDVSSAPGSDTGSASAVELAHVDGNYEIVNTFPFSTYAFHEMEAEIPLVGTIYVKIDDVTLTITGHLQSDSDGKVTGEMTMTQYTLKYCMNKLECNMQTDTIDLSSNNLVQSVTGKIDENKNVILDPIVYENVPLEVVVSGDNPTTLSHATMTLTLTGTTSQLDQLLITSFTGTINGHTKETTISNPPAEFDFPGTFAASQK